MKKFIPIFLGSLLLLLAGCDQIQGLFRPSPEDVLSAYLDASLKGDWDAAYGYISAKDQAEKPLASYKSKFSESGVLAAAVSNKTSYKISSVERKGNKALATVEITAPDLSGLVAEMMVGAMASVFGGKDTAKIQKDIAEKAKSSELPLKVRSEEFKLIQEDQGWRVFFDWATKKKVSGLITEAEQLRKEKKLYAARDKYDAVLELDSKIVTAQKARDELGREIVAFEKKQAYVQNIELYNFKARYYKTYLEKRVPGVEFKLRNKGERALRKVEVTVYFQDANGVVIAEEDFNPVLVTKYSFGDNKPLKPNYVWQQERGKFYQAKSVPSEWKEGAATAKITDIEFVEATD